MTQAKTLPHNGPDWHGYTVDELRYMRAYTAARIEISRDRFKSRAAAIKKDGLVGSSKASMAGKLLGAFGYVDMAILAWRVGRGMFKTVRLFKGK